MNPNLAQGKEVLLPREQTASHLHVLITSMEDIVFEIDGNHVFRNVWVNDENSLFIPPSRFIHKKVGDVMGKYAKLFTKTINKVIVSGEEREVEYKHPNTEIDEWFRVKIKPVSKSEDLDKYILVVVVQNITKQKKSALKLKETKKRLELNVDLMKVSQRLSETSGWELDVRSGMFFWTAQNYALFEVKSGFKPTLEKVLRFFVGEDKELMEKAIGNVICQQRYYDLELRIKTAKGREKWVRAMAKPIIKKGETVRLMGAFMDITLKKKNELVLINLKKAAEEAANVKSQFLSVMSHEIRTPLHGIIGIANLLKLHYTPEQESYVNSLIFSANQLLLLVNDILDLDKFENNRLELWPREVDLFQFVENIKGQFASLAEGKGIAIRTLFDDEPIIVAVDPIRLGQVLNNLIINAIKFTDKGEVTITIHLVSREGNKALVHFSIKDTGIGIPQEFHETLFKSFKQYQQANYSSPGTGLGLSIANQLVEAHNSKLYFKSEVGIGSEFFFELSLPISNKGGVAYPFKQTFEAAFPEMKLTGLNVLVVEDNPISTLIVKKQLESFGIVPDCVDSGKNALELLFEKKHHTILVDLHLPQMDGYTLSKLIRKQSPDTHIIVFTADIREEIKANFATIGVYDILLKPFPPEKIFEKLLKVAKDKRVIQLKGS